MNRLEQIGRTLGSGLAAGAAGTAVMTGVQVAEMKVEGREPSKVPAEAVEKVLGAEPGSEEREQQLAQAVHWTYGTLWGVARAAMPVFGLRGARATGLHLGLVWGSALVILPALGLAPPVTRWPKKQILKDLGMHVAYAVAVGAVVDRLHEPR